MTPEEAKKIVNEIRVISGDDEAAHGKEDDLRESILRHIADHSTDSGAVELAKIALSTGEIDFARWCA